MSAAAQIDPSTGERIQSAGAPQIDPATGERVSATPTDSSNSSPKPTGSGGFLENTLPQSVLHPIQSAEDASAEFKAHPLKSLVESDPAVQTGKALFQGAKRSGGELLEAGKSLFHGNPAAAAVHGINAVPVVGPALVNAAEKPDVGGTGSYLGDVKSVYKSPSAMGTLMGATAQLAPLVAGGADLAAPERPLLGEVPTRAKAGKLFDQAMEKAKDQPVRLSPGTMEPLERTQQLAMAGGKPFGTADKLFQRSQSINPLTYQEARDFSSNMSLSPEEKMSLKRSMKYEVPRLSSGFNADVQQAANDAGVGDVHANAMKTYRRASMIRNGLTGAAKYGIPAAIGTGLIGQAAKKLAQ